MLQKKKIGNFNLQISPNQDGTFNPTDVARVILYLSARSGELLTLQKLAKLLFYEQAYWLAYFKKPLFNEDFENWFYGPMLPSVFEHYHEYGKIPSEGKCQLAFSNKVGEQLFEEVFSVYRGYSERALILMSKQDIVENQEVIDKSNMAKAISLYLKK